MTASRYGEGDDESSLRFVPVRPRILVLDDDELVLSSIRYVLKDEYEVTAVSSPRLALEQLAQQPFDILVTDLMMAEMPGLQVLQEVRAREIDIAVIVVTAYGTKEAVIEALKSGALDFLEKPLTPRGIRRAVGRAWQAMQAQHENQRLLAELRQANAELQRVNAALDAAAAFAELSPSPMVRFGLDGSVVSANPSARSLFTLLERADVRVQWIFPVLEGVDLAQFIEAGRTLTAEQRSGSQSYLIVVKGMPQPGVGHVYAYDVSELKQAEARMLHGQRMEAVGRLAAGVAHDFNNMLTVINLGTRQLLETLEESSKLHATAELIQQAAQRATDLTHQLLAFSRRSLVKPEVLQLNKIITDMKRLLGRTVGEDIQIEVELDPELWQVHQDKTQLEQILTNTVLNARDAMPAGGRLTLKTSNVALEAPHGEALPGRYVSLTVTDTGHGMPKEIAERIFEPFFTTKEAGKGTGMGLATVYGIIKRSGGEVWVESTLGAGTTFTMLFPVARQSASAQAVPAEQPALPLGRGEVILLVEDDKAVRSQLASSLEAHGYRVIWAASGEEGLSLAGKFEQAIGLLLTDVVMPRMSGRDLAMRLRLKQTGLPVLYMSGHAEDKITEQFGVDPASEFIQKPPRIEDLLGKIRALLDAHAATPQ